MNQPDHNKLVQDAELKIQQIRSEAETLVTQIKEYMPIHLTEMANRVVKNTIEENSEPIKKLGEKIKDLKKEISDVIAGFPNEVDKNSINVKWAHTKEIDEKKEAYTLKDTFKKETSSSLSGITQLILGMIGSVFIKYEISKLDNNSYWKKEYSSSILFSYGMDFYHHGEKTEFQLYREKYDYLTSKYIDAMKELTTAISNRNKADANKLWDEA